MAVQSITQPSPWFQSTPPSGERSDPTSRTNDAESCTVSIHAPLRREERRDRVLKVHEKVQFQSTPPSGERSDSQRRVRP